MFDLLNEIYCTAGIRDQDVHGVDLGNLNNSLSMHTTGQSGHAYHTHYDDMVSLWAAGKYYPMWWEADSVKQAAESRLTLTP